MSGRSSTSLVTSLADRVKAERRRYGKRLERGQRDFSEKSVHDLRVETRRLLALSDVLLALDFPGPLTKIRKAFKKRLDAFDELRDTHVQLLLLKPLCQEFPEARELDALLCERAQRLTDDLRKEVHATKQAHWKRRLKTLEEELRDSAGEMAGQVTRLAILSAVDEAFDQVVALSRHVRPDRTATIHRTRVAFKRFRYMCELLCPYLPELKAADLGRMREYQSMMGNIQDIVVLLAGLRRAVADKEINGRIVGPLRRELLRRRRELTDIYLAAADRLFDFEPNASATEVRAPVTLSEGVILPHLADSQLIKSMSNPDSTKPDESSL
jgi:CHAD domain-containing protein